MSTGGRLRDALGGGGARRRGRTRGGRGDASPGVPQRGGGRALRRAPHGEGAARARDTSNRRQSTCRPAPPRGSDPTRNGPRPRARSRPRRLDLGARLDELARRRVERAAPNDRRRGQLGGTTLQRLRRDDAKPSRARDIPWMEIRHHGKTRLARVTRFQRGAEDSRPRIVVEDFLTTAAKLRDIWNA